MKLYEKGNPMKKKILTSLALTLLFSVADVRAKSLINSIDKYIINSSNQVIEIASSDIDSDGLTAKYWDYKIYKKLSVNMHDVTKATMESINDVSAGEMILVTTKAARNDTAYVNRYCQVFHLFENKKAFVGCKTYEIDNIKGHTRPARLDFIINNVEDVTPEVEMIDHLAKGEIATLKVDTLNAKAGKAVRVLALFSNGEALVQKIGLGTLSNTSIIYKSSIDRVKITDLEN